MPAIPQLDKSLETSLGEEYGTITIRVVVLEKSTATTPPSEEQEGGPVDAVPEEALPESDKRPTGTFLEEPKKGRQCCVFLINGQRQHAWDNFFIIRNLDLKYLRNRMLVIVDCDGLRPDAIAHLMQGSRFQFFEGAVYAALESRVLATLKGDPDLRRLEEEAEDEISSLQAGDEAVKAALDQLIEAHHESAYHETHGTVEPGEATREEGMIGSLVQSQEVIIEGSSGMLADQPVLGLRPDIATLRLRPNEARKFLIYPKPEAAWNVLGNMALTLDPPINELQVVRTAQSVGEEVSLKFLAPEDFDDDEYPIETVLRSTAVFKGSPEPRLLERRVVINVPKKRTQKDPVPLKDDPTFIKVASRQPIKIMVPGPDVHVKLRWDGRDDLVTSVSPTWAFHVSCESPSVQPPIFLTRPDNGRLELLIQAASGLHAGEQLKLTVDAIGPGKTLTTAFLADVVEPPAPRKITTQLSGGAQRRPPYNLQYVKKENWNQDTCWGGQWTGEDAGAFDPPSTKSPLTIFVNQDMDLLANYRETLISKKHAETTIQQRINKYTAHVAFHLYQMHLKQKADTTAGTDEMTDGQMRQEIQRVARTLLKLMEVSQ